MWAPRNRFESWRYSVLPVCLWTKDWIRVPAGRFGMGRATQLAWGAGGVQQEGLGAGCRGSLTPKGMGRWEHTPGLGNKGLAVASYPPGRRRADRAALPPQAWGLGCTHRPSPHHPRPRVSDHDRGPRCGGSRQGSAVVSLTQQFRQLGQAFPLPPPCSIGARKGTLLWPPVSLDPEPQGGMGPIQPSPRGPHGRRTSQSSGRGAKVMHGSLIGAAIRAVQVATEPGPSL